MTPVACARMADGFVYVSDADPGPMAYASVGARVLKASVEPPWIVVDHSLDRIIVASWPGRLFRVAIVPPGTDEERTAMRRAAGELAPDAGYTRALGIDVLEELPPSVLFGPHGAAVADVIGFARALTGEMAARLASAVHPRAAEVYRTVWASWSAARSRSGDQPADFSGVDAVHRAGRTGSPVGSGLMVVDRAVWERAEASGGVQAARVEGQPELVLSEPWAAAGTALIEAALAVGAPELVDDAEAAVLTTAWRAVQP